MVSVFAVLRFLAAALIGLILMHSGRDAGFGGIGFTPGLAGRHAHRRAQPDAADASSVAMLFVVNTVVLFQLLA